ncbi:DUF6879 family protein [Streptomyces sp. MS19]|uniref:DUF6879 family protein n=1 Tax=Streptomyces sp. MS19 TaxID=3385972 RepID=UPI00399F21CE
MTTSSKTLGDWLHDFEREAFRLETLDDYGKSGGVAAYQAFLAGEPQPENYRTDSWVTTVGDAVRAGKRMYRVHILARPLTDYLRYELSWGYRRNMTAGEEFFILDTTEEELNEPAHYLYTTVTDPAYRDVKPGTVMALWAVNRAAGQGRTWVRRGCHFPGLVRYYRTQGFELVHEVQRTRTKVYLMGRRAEHVTDLEGRFGALSGPRSDTSA